MKRENRTNTRIKYDKVTTSTSRTSSLLQILGESINLPAHKVFFAG